MKICFLGVGGVGGYSGALVSKCFNNQHEIYFVARGKQKEAICNNGLTLKKSGGNEIINAMPHKCTDNIEEISVCDIIILSVKSYDLDNAVKKISTIAGQLNMRLQTPTFYGNKKTNINNCPSFYTGRFLEKE